MSEVKTTILEGPDGRLYEIPDDTLAEYVVPGEKVGEIRARLAGAPRNTPPSRPSEAPHDGASPPPDLPPGHYRPGAMPAMSLEPNARGVTLNFYFSGRPPAFNMSAAYPPAEAEVEGYHMSFDEQGIPVNHTEMLWGDYIDKQGNPAVGFHSHDPATGNAQ